MAFAETENTTRTGAVETDAPVRTGKHLPPRPDRTAGGGTMDFVLNTEEMAGNLRGLAALFKGTFLDTSAQLPDDQVYAGDIVHGCMLSIAQRIEDNAEAARQASTHAARGAR